MKIQLPLLSAVILSALPCGLSAQTDVTTDYFTSVDGAIVTGSWNIDYNGATTFGMLYADSADGIAGGSLAFTGSASLFASVGNAVSGGAITFGGFDGATFSASAANAVSGGNTTFNDLTVLTALAADSVSGGTQSFNGNTTLYASVAAAVSGGTQNFAGNANFNISETGALSGGIQNFEGSAHLDASQSGAVAGGTQNFNGTSVLFASATNAVNGGEQNFHEDSHLQVTTSNAVNGGVQTFDGFSHLEAATSNAVVGGAQNFGETSKLLATASDAVVGGLQVFSGGASLTASVANAVSGGTQTFSGSATLNATATDAVKAGNLVLSMDSSVLVGAANALHTGTAITFDNTPGGAGGTLVLNGHSIEIGAISSAAGGIIRNGAAGPEATFSVSFDTSSSSYGGVIEDGAGSGPLAVTKGGTGTLELTGANTYTGDTRISGGTLLVDNVGGSATGTGDIFVEAGATLGGAGAVTGGVVVTGTISPGDSPGTLHTGAQTWDGAGAYSWEINDATGSPGTNWDTLSIEGSLTISATSATPFLFKITTLDGSLPGPMANFNYGTEYTWLVATTTDGIFGFDPGSVIFDTAGFSNPDLPGFDFSVVGNDLYVVAVPEPSISSVILLGLAVIGLETWRRRRDSHSSA